MSINNKTENISIDATYLSCNKKIMMFTISTISLTKPGDGVSPPSVRELHTSISSAPPWMAFIADSKLSIQTSNMVCEGNIIILSKLK